MRAGRAMKPRRSPLNQFAFRCKTCMTRFEVGTTRITGRNCASCATAATFIATHARKAPVADLCANCGHPFGHRRAVPAADGQKVHYRCPTITRSQRATARAAPS